MAIVFAFTVASVSAQNAPTTKTSTEKVVKTSTDNAAPAVSSKDAKAPCSTKAPCSSKADGAKAGCAKTCSGDKAKACCSKDGKKSEAKPVPAPDNK